MQVADAAGQVAVGAGAAAAADGAGEWSWISTADEDYGFPNDADALNISWALSSEHC